MDTLTVSQAAVILGLSPRGVRDRIERGQMQAIRVNPRLLLIPRAEIERWRTLGRPRRHAGADPPTEIAAGDEIPPSLMSPLLERLDALRARFGDRVFSDSTEILRELREGEPE